MKSMFLACCLLNVFLMFAAHSAGHWEMALHATEMSGVWVALFWLEWKRVKT